MPELTVTGQRSPAERREVLAGEISRYVRDGYRVESQTDHQAIVVRGRRPNHLLHFLLGIITVSLWWLLVWLPLCVFGGEKRRVLTVDTFGNVQVAKGRG